MSRKYTTEEFKQLLEEIHPGQWDYSLLEYKGIHKTVKLICTTCNNICEPLANNAKKKDRGCKYCSNNYQKTTKQFVQEAKEVHGNKYDYSITNYTNNSSKVWIICPKEDHGPYEQVASSHLQGSGCWKCQLRFWDAKSFIRYCGKVHNNKYQYKDTIFVDNNTEVEIYCSKHKKNFKQLPSVHANGHGCQLCGVTSSSYEEQIISSIKEYYIGPIDTRKYIKSIYNDKRYQLDIYLPELNLAIEYNGNAYHHSTKDCKSKYLNNTRIPKKYHFHKYDVAKQNGIDLIHIFEFENLDDWLITIKNIILNRDKYQIRFTNELRQVECKRELLDYYGKTIIKHRATTDR